MIAIDANANGVFFEPEDRVFFNNVNPYRQNSAHAELRGFLGNYWYRVSELEEHHLIEVGLRGGKLRFTSPNARYAGIAERGSLIVQNLPAGASVSLNGRTYWPKVSGVFEAPIEFGVYQLRIGAPGAADQVEQLTVDEAHRAIAVAYRPAPAGALSLQNLSLDHWKVVVRRGDRLVGVHPDARVVHLAPGSYDVSVEAGGSWLSRMVNVECSQTTSLDYGTSVPETGQ